MQCPGDTVPEPGPVAVRADSRAPLCLLEAVERALQLPAAEVEAAELAENVLSVVSGGEIQGLFVGLAAQLVGIIFRSAAGGIEVVVEGVLSSSCQLEVLGDPHAEPGSRSVIQLQQEPRQPLVQPLRLFLWDRIEQLIELQSRGETIAPGVFEQQSRGDQVGGPLRDGYSFIFALEQAGQQTLVKGLVDDPGGYEHALLGGAEGVERQEHLLPGSHTRRFPGVIPASGVAYQGAFSDQLAERLVKSQWVAA